MVAFYALAWDGTPAFDGDSAGYLQIATDLAHGGLSQLPARTLGYPAFLFLTGSAPAPGATLLVTQLILHMGAVALMLPLLRQLRASRAAMAVFVAVALAPPFVEHASFVLTESLTQLCVVAGLAGFAMWLCGSSGWFLAASAAGLAVVGIIQPSNALLWLVVPVLALTFCRIARVDRVTWRRCVFGAVTVAAVAMPMLASMVAFNQIRFGFAGLSPMLGATLSHKTSRVLELLPGEYADVREILIRYRDASLLDPKSQHLGLAYIFRAMPELEAKTGLHGAELSSYLVKMNLALIRRAPMDYTDEVLRSGIWYWAPGVTARSGFGSGALKAVWNGLRALVLVTFALAMALLSGPSAIFVAGLRSSGSASSRSDLARELVARLQVLFLFLGAVGYSTLVSTALTAAVYRLRIPFDLPILACAVLGPSTWLQLRAPLERAYRIAGVA